MICTQKAGSTLVIAFALLFLSSNSFAAIKLTAPMIDQWIKSQSSFAAWGEENEQQLNSAESSNKPQQTEELQNPLNMSASSLIEPLKSAGLYDSASELVKQHQFNSLEQWANITIRITTAAAAIELENNPKAMDTTELEALQASSRLSPEQKALISQAIKQNQILAKQLIENTTDMDKQAVKPFLPRIHNLMNETY